MAPWKSARRSCGRTDHRSEIEHVPFKKNYNGHDFTRSNASEALDRDPTGANLMSFIMHIVKIKSGASIQDQKAKFYRNGSPLRFHLDR